MSATQRARIMLGDEQAIKDAERLAPVPPQRTELGGLQIPSGEGGTTGGAVFKEAGRVRLQMVHKQNQELIEELEKKLERRLDVTEKSVFLYLHRGLGNKDESHDFIDSPPTDFSGTSIYENARNELLKFESRAYANTFLQQGPRPGYQSLPADFPGAFASDTKKIEATRDVAMENVVKFNSVVNRRNNERGVLNRPNFGQRATILTSPRGLEENNLLGVKTRV